MQKGKVRVEARVGTDQDNLGLGRSFYNQYENVKFLACDKLPYPQDNFIIQMNQGKSIYC